VLTAPHRLFAVLHWNGHIMLLPTFLNRLWIRCVPMMP